MASETSAIASPESMIRHSSRRTDVQWLANAKRNNKSRFVVIHDDAFLADAEPVSGNPRALWMPGDKLIEAAGNSDILEKGIYLGDYRGVPFFALCVSASVAGMLTSDCDLKRSFVDLRSNLGRMPAGDANVVSLARFLVIWNRRHRFCGVCGSVMKRLHDGHACKCSGEGCGEEFYASMDPAVIVLVTSGDRCLLGRAHNWRSGLYSTLAGFVEPGETLEQAVKREILEESGIEVEDIHYQASQSWLFPASLMLGFTAKAIHTEIHMDPHEMQDVRWFTREALLESPDQFPSSASIAYHLIRTWLHEETDGH